jgi:hypothetical protein
MVMFAIKDKQFILLGMTLIGNRILIRLLLLIEDYSRTIRVVDIVQTCEVITMLCLWIVYVWLVVEHVLIPKCREVQTTSDPSKQPVIVIQLHGIQDHVIEETKLRIPLTLPTINIRSMMHPRLRPVISRHFLTLIWRYSDIIQPIPREVVRSQVIMNLMR